MRRVTLVLTAVAMMVSLFAVAAYAAEIRGTGKSEILNESERDDLIVGHRGDDTINAALYDIEETPGGFGDTDEVKGNKSDDFIDVQDGDGLDTADGGPGVDECLADPGDDVEGCEL